jgi:hypothetical protein
MSETMDICYSEQIPGGAKLEHLPNLAQPQELARRQPFVRYLAGSRRLRITVLETHSCGGFEKEQVHEVGVSLLGNLDWLELI